METHVRYENGVVIIQPQGKLNREPNIRDFQDSILPEVKAFDQPLILINLSDTRRMSSSGLSVLMQAYTLTKQKQGRIAVIHASRHINNLLVLSRLASLFECFDDEADAVAALSMDLPTLETPAIDAEHRRRVPRNTFFH
ncbi:MAG: STAS domain-containing protein [Candidatus Poribacteria bacterium]|nr:STAS domain-containing protein [Candidatus Poribacteria bacterium]